MKKILLFLFLFSIIFLIIGEVQTSYAVVSFPTTGQRLDGTPTYCIISPEGLTATERGEYTNLAIDGVSEWNTKLQGYEQNNPAKWRINSKVILSTEDRSLCDITIDFKKEIQQISAPGKKTIGIFHGGYLQSIGIAYGNMSIGVMYNIIIHEIGHSLGLGHYVSDDNDENKKWYTGKDFSPSIMIPTTNHDPNLMTVMGVDLLKVRSIYGTNGFLAFPPESFPIIPQPTPTPTPIIPKDPIIPISPIESIQISDLEIISSKYETKYVKITGQIKDEYYLKGTKVFITVKNPDMSFTVHSIRTTSDGYFELPQIIDGDTVQGWYEVKASYLEHTDTNLDFFFHVGSQKYEYPEKIIPKVELTLTQNSKSGKYLQNISVESKNNDYTVTSYFTENVNAMPSMRITAENHCSIKKQLFQKDYQFIPGKKITFSFFQLPDEKPSECSIYFILEDFNGKTIEEIIVYYKVENKKQSMANIPKITSEFSKIQSLVSIPSWIKNNAGWWAEGQIGDLEFANGIQHLLAEKIIDIPDLPDQASEKSQEGIPDWVKNNAGWWADGKISEDDFINGIKYLVAQGIIRV